jgi:hypothetical protein
MKDIGNKLSDILRSMEISKKISSVKVAGMDIG